MRKKGTVAAQKDEALTKRYGQIGISAVAAAARYQRPDMSEKSLAARSKSKGDNSAAATVGAVSRTASTHAIQIERKYNVRKTIKLAAEPIQCSTKSPMK